MMAGQKGEMILFGNIQVLRMQEDGQILEEHLHPEKIETYLGGTPIHSVSIGGGLKLFFSVNTQISRSSERVTVLYGAAGQVRTRIYGNTLIGRRNRFGYIHTQDADIALARWLVRVLGKENGHADF